MTFELEISTMHKSQQDCLDMLKKMNVKCDCLIINQCDEERYFETQLDNQWIRIFFTKERGLSRSRNMALLNCKADILGIADDDLYYYDNFEKIILKMHEEKQLSDLILFNVDSYKRVFSDKSYDVSFMKLFQSLSVMLTIKIKSVRDKSLKFNELFGTGTQIFKSGEEHVFLADCYHSGLKIIYWPEKILKIPQSESTWFKGYTDEFIETRGAVLFAMNKKIYLLLILLMSFKNRKKFQHSFIYNLKHMMLGARNYKKISNS